MELTELQKKIWDIVKSDLAHEPVASTDHVERMTQWCQTLGPAAGADMEVLVAGALLHDVGVVIHRQKHYAVGRNRAAEILKEVQFPEEKIDAVLHVLEAHSRYGGAPGPRTPEAEVGQDADALEYIGAIGILRALHSCEGGRHVSLFTSCWNRTVALEIHAQFPGTDRAGTTI